MEHVKYIRKKAHVDTNGTLVINTYAHTKLPIDSFAALRSASSSQPSEKTVHLVYTCAFTGVRSGTVRYTWSLPYIYIYIYIYGTY